MVNFKITAILFAALGLAACSAGPEKLSSTSGVAALLGGDKAGNGGGAWVCREKNGDVRWIKFIDLFEAQSEYGLQIDEREGSYENIVDLILMRLNRIDSKLFAAVNDRIDRLDKLKPGGRIHYTNDTLEVINDSLYDLKPDAQTCAGGALVVDPKGGRQMVPYEQVVNYRDDGTILIQENLFNRLSETQKAALVFHEAIYAYRRESAQDRDSVLSRRIVGILFSHLSVPFAKLQLDEILSANEPPLPKADPKSYILIPGGTYYVGNPDGMPLKVQVSTFELQAAPVTQQQWFEVMHFPYKTAYSYRDACRESFEQTGLGGICTDFPLDNLTWEEAMSFIDMLNSADTGYRYRLPTEAEWEFAATSGGTSFFPFDQGLDLFKFIFGLVDDSRMYNFVVQPVGRKPPNPRGLYDMYGNVITLVSDWYSPHRQAGVDPQGPISGVGHVLRGCTGQQVVVRQNELQSGPVYCTFNSSRFSTEAPKPPQHEYSRLTGMRLVRIKR